MELTIEADRQGAGERAESSLELLVHQLLQQNAALHQELLEARLSSGSCSNVSIDGRSEGRGSRRAGVGMQRKGKGIGSDLAPIPDNRSEPRVFTPPWTSFATTSDQQAQPLAPMSAGLPGLVKAAAPSASPPVVGSLFDNVPREWDLPLRGAAQSGPPVPMQSDSGDQARSGKRGLPVSHEYGEVIGLARDLENIRLGASSNDGMSLAMCPRRPVQASPPELSTVTPSNDHPLDALPPRPYESWSKPSQLQIPTPSIGDLEAPHETREVPIPPLPRFTESANLQQVRLIVDGVPRTGYIGVDGGIRLAEIPHFSIGSDHEGDELPSFGGVKGRGSRNPFEPGAGSPFRPVDNNATSAGQPAAGEASPPPPPSVAEPPLRSQRRRSPSPKTPPGRRTGWTAQGFSPTTPGGTRVPAGPPPPSPPPICSGGSCDSGSMRSSPAVMTPDPAGDKDFIPGERTMWELPKLGPTSESQPALRCNDWLHRIKPSIHDLAPKAHVWWSIVMKEAREAYDSWCIASPLDRAVVCQMGLLGLKAGLWLC